VSLRLSITLTWLRKLSVYILFPQFQRLFPSLAPAYRLIHNLINSLYHLVRYVDRRNYNSACGLYCKSIDQLCANLELFQSPSPQPCQHATSSSARPSNRMHNLLKLTRPLHPPVERMASPTASLRHHRLFPRPTNLPSPPQPRHCNSKRGIHI
jgi:hypothetical protein